MPSRDDIVDLLERIADIADGVKRKLIYVLALGTIAAAYLACRLYSPEAVLWWNVLKCGLIALPSLIWLFIWSVLGQLQQAPSLIAKLVQDDQGVFANTQSLSLNQPKSLVGVFSTLRAFRREDGFSVVFDAIGGVGILANPLFALIAVVTLGSLFFLIFCALLSFVF